MLGAVFLFLSSFGMPFNILKIRSNLSGFHQRGFFESDFLSEQKNPLEDLLFFLLTSQEEAA